MNLLYKIAFPVLLFGQLNLFSQTKSSYPNFEYYANSNNISCEAVLVSNTKELKNSNDIINFLLTAYQKEIGKESSFILTHQAKSLVGKHFTFQQTINNVPVFNSFIKLNTDFEGKIISGHKKLFTAENCIFQRSDTDLFFEKIENYLAQEKLEKEQEVKAVWFENKDGSLEIAYEVLAKRAENYFRVVLDERANLLHFENRSVYNNCSGKCCGSATLTNHGSATLTNHGSAKFILSEAERLTNRGSGLLNRLLTKRSRSMPDSTIQVAVFLPDPLTSAEKEYGGFYIDGNDEDIEELNNERFSETIKAKFENGIFSLENDFVKLTDNLAPNFTPTVNSSPNFVFTRSETGFENVNVFYHITKFQEYLQSLGVDLANKQVNADAHSLNGADNSRFVADASGKIFLDFGEGNVDDAEDADVIIHEYTHALSYMASNSNTGSQRRAIDEAIGDYFATSWSRSFSEYRWQDMFTWDGHNEFWNGRNMETNKVYPINVSSDIYGSSEVFSSMLMELYEALGRETTDLLVSQLLYFLAPNMNMQEAAEAILEVDNILFEGANNTVICQKLFKRRLITELHISAGKDTTLCLGETLTLGDTDWNLDGLEFSWSANNTQISNADSVQVNITPTSSDIYFLNVTDLINNNTYTDEITVLVENCIDFEGNVYLVNQANFASGRGDLILNFGENVSNSAISIFDVQGRIIKNIAYESNAPLKLELTALPASIYFVQVKIEEEISVFKVVKGR